MAATISAPLSAACAARPGRRSSGRKTFLDQSLRLLEIPEDCRQTIGLHAPASGARRTLQHRQPQPDGGQVIVHFMKSSRIASAGGIAAAVRASFREGAGLLAGLDCEKRRIGIRCSGTHRQSLSTPSERRSACYGGPGRFDERDRPAGMEGVTSAPLPLAPEAIPGGRVCRPW